MFHLKKKGRKHASKAHNALRSFLRPKLEALGRKLRLSGRVRLLNRWGRRNPGLMGASYAFIAAILIALNVLSMFRPDVPANADSNLVAVRDVMADSSARSVFDGMSRINRNREAINNINAKYAERGAQVASEADSLANLPVKSREDSLRLALKLQKLLP